MSRTLRLAHELVRRQRTAALEGFDIHEDPRMENPDEDSKYLRETNESRKKHYRVVTLEKTRQKLEKWFRERDIPIRIVYGERDQVSPIPKKGVITYQYMLLPNQEPPTAWIIVHNLSHAIFDKSSTPGYGNPHLYQSGHTPFVNRMFEMLNEMESFSEEPSKRIYPTTRSMQTGKVTSTVEMFHEIFTQWVVTGHVKLKGSDSEKTRALETQMEALFRQAVDQIAQSGTVLTNL